MRSIVNAGLQSVTYSNAIKLTSAPLKRCCSLVYDSGRWQIIASRYRPMRTLLLILITLLSGATALAQSPADFPLVSGIYKMTKGWEIDLGNQEFRRRVEDGSLVIWRPGITMWIGVWEYPKEESRSSFIERKRSRSGLPSGSEIIEIPANGNTSYFGYFFSETEQGSERWSLQTFTFGPSDHVLMAIYFDDKRDVETAKKLWKGVRTVTTGGNGPARAGRSS